MQIITRFSMSADGYVTTPDGWPAMVAAPGFVSGQSHGWPEFQKRCGAVLMGRTTFEPALGASRWPWPDLDVFVLGSERPEGTPDEVVFDDDPERLLAAMRASHDGDLVHLVGGPKTIQTFVQLGALDRLGLLVLPVLFGDGMRLTDALSPDVELTLDSESATAEGAVDVVYACKA
jgi:dihydrofolate reductase